MKIDSQFWIDAVQWIIWGIVMAGVMGWVATQRGRFDISGGPNRLSHPKAILVLGWLGVVFFAGIAVVSNVFPNDTVTWWTNAIFLGFASMSVLIIVEYYRVHHEYSEEGLHFGRLFGSRGYLRWDMLASVEYSESMKWFRLQTKSGEIARISASQRGLPGFADTLLRRAPEGTIEEQTEEILRTTAGGNPPALW